jgi:hypothetical protein
VSAAKHTPGPWKFGHHGVEALWIGPDYNRAPVALVPHDTEAARETSRDDARLMAAAPDLLEALDKLAHYAECQVAAFTSGRPHLDMTLFPSLCKEARAAIAKATGSAV